MRVKFQTVQADGLCCESTFQGKSLSIGRDPSSEIAVEPTHNRTVSWNHARIDCEGGKLLVRDLKSRHGTYLNGVKIARVTQLELGDAIQLGRAGAKYLLLEYSLTADAEQAGTGGDPGECAEVARDASARVACSCSSCGAAFEVAVEFAGRKTCCPLCSAPLGTAAQSESSGHLRKDQPATPPGADAQGAPAKQEENVNREMGAVGGRHEVEFPGRLSRLSMSVLAVLRLHERANERLRMFAIFAGAGLLVVLIALICVTVVVGGRNRQALPPESVSTSEKSVGDRGKAATESDANEEKPAAQLWSDVFERVKDSVLLVGIEEPKGRSSWPLATCCVIREDTLLCSARVAYELARFRRSGWKIWAGRPWQGVREEVLEIRVHKLFEKTIQEPDKWVYFNTALLTTRGKLTKTAAEMASREDLAELAAGMPVACLAISHDGEAINRFQVLSPELVVGSVFGVTTLPPTPGGPRLLHLEILPRAKIYGSPLFNVKGRLIGIYSEAAALEKNQAVKDLNIHYGTVVEPDLVKMRWQGQSDEVWVVPGIVEIPGAPSAKE